MNNPATQKDQPQKNLLDDVLDTAQYDKKVKQAQNALFIVTVVYLIGGIIQIFTDNSEEWLINLSIIVVIALMFLGLGLWCKYKPVVALIIALVLYLGIFILTAVANPASIFRGLYFKAIIVVLLIKGIIAANDAQQIKKLGK